MNIMKGKDKGDPQAKGGEPLELGDPLSGTMASDVAGVALATEAETGGELSAADRGKVDPRGGVGRIGDRLKQMGYITDDQLNVALQEKKNSDLLLGEILVDLGFISRDVLMNFLSESAGIAVFDPKATMIDMSLQKYVSKDMAMRYQVLPVSLSEEEALVAMVDPYDVVALDALRASLPKGVVVKPLLLSLTMLTDTIDSTYGFASSIPDILEELESENIEADLSKLSAETSYTHPIVRLVNALVFDAVKIGASDLHFEPEENFARLRYRKDGELFTVQTLHKKHWNAIAQRLKIMSHMDIADKLSPQDGRFYMNVGGREADFRVSSLPTVHGENIVLRVLDQSASIIPLEKLGFSAHNLDLIRRSQARPEGIIIVTGPTGSGKTTSLYSMLNEINTVDVNIQTLEDPVEYSLPMIRQTHVREGILDFADGIKALLRQDPDIIFIGEIRDKNTAEMALKAAMTGHQVYTTLHTNDSFGALPRLIDSGMKPGMVAGSIISVFAQRLVRKVCPQCRESYRPNEEECRILGIDPQGAQPIYKAHQGGCDHCEGQGYKGRTAVVEILMFDEDMDAVVAAGASLADLKSTARAKGFKSMRRDGIEKVLDGVTTIEALARVVGLEE